jgi:iron(III) transport system ATP-binding protein
VDAVDLQIVSGELFFLLGPSGCGKTTILRMIAGFVEPTSGDIDFGDHCITDVPANQRNTGMVFQSYALWPHMTVRQNVAFGLEVRKLPAEQRGKRVEAALGSVQMLAYADRKPNELSGGQQQRVALARALVVEPTVLLLDEPLSNLDAKLRIEMRSQIREVCKGAGITAIYVTHDQKEALSMADRVAVLREGRLMQVGPPRVLYERPANRFVADFLGQTNFTSAEVIGREGELVVLRCEAGILHSAVFPGDLPSTGNVTCSIRPEAFKLSAANGVVAEHVPNHFVATRQQVTYLGEMAQYEMMVGEHWAVTVFELNPRVIDAQAGSVRMTVDPRDVVVLHD